MRPAATRAESRRRGVAARIWAAPVSLLGLLAAPAFRDVRVVDGVILLEGLRGAAGARSNRAITLGHVVLAVRPMGDRVLAHEMVHVRQYERWGPVMPLAYLAAGAFAGLRSRRPYRDNPFEVAARDAEPVNSRPPVAE